MMKVRVAPSGYSAYRLDKTIESAFKKSENSCMFIACAYVSIHGTRYIKGLYDRLPLKQVSLVSDIRDGITHPEALRHALDSGWSVRTVNRSQGTFHPKVFVGSAEMETNLPVKPCLSIIGSGNLSRGGLVSNIECNQVLTSDTEIARIAEICSDFWKLGTDLTPAKLADYEKYFAAINRERPVRDLSILGISEEIENEDVANMKTLKPAVDKIVSTSVSEAAWTGLETFTGEYRFQVEFPKNAGNILNRIINLHGNDGNVDVNCADGLVRGMRYKYYDHNGMFRLNIPNEVPGVASARLNKRGVAIVQLTSLSRPGISLTVSEDPKIVNDAKARSFALGTWGKTSTRVYGWY